MSLPAMCLLPVVLGFAVDPPADGLFLDVSIPGCSMSGTIAEQQRVIDMDRLFQTQLCGLRYDGGHLLVMVTLTNTADDAPILDVTEISAWTVTSADASGATVSRALGTAHVIGPQWQLAFKVERGASVREPLQKGASAQWIVDLGPLDRFPADKPVVLKLVRPKSPLVQPCPTCSATVPVAGRLLVGATEQQTFARVAASKGNEARRLSQLAQSELTPWAWNPAKAEEHCRAALALEPDNRGLTLLLGTSLHEQGKSDEALALLRGVVAAPADKDGNRAVEVLSRRWSRPPKKHAEWPL